MAELEDDSAITGSSLPASPPIPSLPISGPTILPDSAITPDTYNNTVSRGATADIDGPPQLFDALMKQSDWSGIGEDLISKFQDQPVQELPVPQSNAPAIPGTQSVPNSIGNFFSNLGTQVKKGTDDIGNWYQSKADQIGNTWNTLNSPYGTTDIQQQQQIAENQQQQIAQGGQQLGNFIGQARNVVDNFAPLNMLIGAGNQTQGQNILSTITYPIQGLANWFQDSNADRIGQSLQQNLQSGNYKGAFDNLTSWLSTAENDIFDPRVLAPVLKRSFQDNGMSINDAKEWSNGIAPLANMLYSFAGPQQGLAIISFFADMLDDPKKMIQQIGQGNQEIGDIVDAYVHGSGKILDRDQNGNTDGSRRNVTGVDFGNAVTAIANYAPIAISGFHTLKGLAEKGEKDASTITTEGQQDSTSIDSGQGETSLTTQGTGETGQNINTGTPSETGPIQAIRNATAPENPSIPGRDQFASNLTSDNAAPEQGIQQASTESTAAGSGNAKPITQKDFDNLVETMQDNADQYGPRGIEAQAKNWRDNVGVSIDVIKAVIDKVADTYGLTDEDHQAILNNLGLRDTRLIDGYRVEGPDSMGNVFAWKDGELVAIAFKDANGNVVDNHNGTSDPKALNILAQQLNPGIRPLGQKRAYGIGPNETAVNSSKEIFDSLPQDSQSRLRGVMGEDAVDAAKADQLEMQGTEVQRDYPQITPDAPRTEAPAYINDRTMQPMQTQPVAPNAEREFINNPNGPIAKSANTPRSVIEAFLTPESRRNNDLEALYKQLKDRVDPYGILRDNFAYYRNIPEQLGNAPWNRPIIGVNLKRESARSTINAWLSQVENYLTPGENPEADRVAKEFLNDLNDIEKNPAILSYNFVDHESTHQYDYEIYGIDRNSETPWRDLSLKMIRRIPIEVLNNWAEQGLDFSKLLDAYREGRIITEEEAIQFGRDIIEMSVHQAQLYKRIPGAQYAWGIPEVFANNVKNPKLAQEGAQAYGKFRDSLIQERFASEQVRPGANTESRITPGIESNVSIDEAAAARTSGNLNESTTNSGGINPRAGNREPSLQDFISKVNDFAHISSEHNDIVQSMMDNAYDYFGINVTEENLEFWRSVLSWARNEADARGLSLSPAMAREESPQDIQLPASIKDNEAGNVEAKIKPGILDPKLEKTLKTRLNLVGAPQLPEFLDLLSKGDTTAKDVYSKLGANMRKAIDAALQPSQESTLVEKPVISRQAAKADQIVNESFATRDQVPSSNRLNDDVWLRRAQSVINMPRHPASLEARLMMTARDMINVGLERGIPQERVGDLEQAYDLASQTFQNKLAGLPKKLQPKDTETISEIKSALQDIETRTTKAANDVISKPDLDGNVELDARMVAEGAGYTLESARDLLNGHVQYGFMINNKSKQILKATDPKVNTGSWSHITITGKSGRDFKYDPTTGEIKIFNDNHLHLGQRSDIVKSWDTNFTTFLKGELRRGSVAMPENLTPEQNAWRQGIEIKSPGGQPFRPKTKAEQHAMLNYVADLVDKGFVHPMDENPMSKSDIWQEWLDFGKSLSNLGVSKKAPPAIPDLIGQVSRADWIKRNRALAKRAQAEAEFTNKLEKDNYDISGLNRLSDEGGGPPDVPRDPTISGDEYEEGPSRKLGTIQAEMQDRFIKLADHGSVGKDLGNAFGLWVERVLDMGNIHDKYNLSYKTVGTDQEAKYNAGAWLVGNKILPAIKKMIPDTQTRIEITKALDVNDVSADQRANERQARIDALPTQAARDLAWATASLHDFIGNVGRARGVMDTAVDYYITHAFKPDVKDVGFYQKIRNKVLYGQKGTRGSSFNQIGQFKQKRAIDPETGEYKYPTLDSLRDAFEKEPYEDISDIFGIHLNGFLHAASIKDMKDFLGSHDWKSGNNESVPSLASYEDVKNSNITGAINPDLYRAVNKGSYKKTFTGYLIHKELADQLERHSSPFESADVLNSLARADVKIGSAYRGGTFISPFHSFSVHSILASRIAAEDTSLLGMIKGMTFLPAWFRSIQLAPSGARLLRDDPSYISSKLIGLGGMKPPEVIASVEGLEQNKGFYQSLPGIKYIYDWVWNKDITNAAFGFAKYLDDSRRAKLGRELTPAEEIQHYRQIVQEVGKATGLIPREDIPNWFKAFSKSMLTGSEFTYTQAMIMARSVPFAKDIPGLKKSFTAREKDVVPGAEAYQKAVLARNNRLGTMGLFYAMWGMALSSEIANVLGGYLADGQVNNIWDNFLDSPEHMFDIYHGVDANGRRMYYHLPIYGAYNELAAYGLAYIDARRNGKSDVDAVRATISRLSGKLNPVNTVPLEALTNVELYKWLGNYKDGKGNSSFNLLPDASGKGGDSALNQLSQLLDAVNIPQGPGNLRDRLAFAMNSYKNLLPYAGLSPMTVPESQGEGVYKAQDIVNNPGNFAKQAAIGAGLKLLGTYEQYGPNRVQTGPYAGLTGSQAYGPVDARKIRVTSDEQQLFQLVNQPPSNDPKENQQRLQMEVMLATRNNWSPSKVTQIIQVQQQAFDKAQYTAEQQALVRNPAQRAANAAEAQLQGAVNAQTLTVNGQSITLDPNSSDSLRTDLVQGRFNVLNLLNQDPQYRSLSQFDKAAMQNTFNTLSDSLIRQKMSQQLGYSTGALSEATIHTILQKTLDARETATQVVSATDAYAKSDPAEQKRMIQTSQNLASTLVSDAYTKNIKGVTPDTIPLILNDTLKAQTATRSYLETTPWYQQADPLEQTKMVRQYDNVVAQLARNEVINMTPNVAKFLGSQTAFNPIAVTMAARNIVNTQEATLDLLHQQEYYVSASPQEQAALDGKYIKLARNIAAYQASGPNSGLITDYKQVPTAFKYQMQAAISGAIYGEQAQFDLQNQFGGSDVIKGYGSDLAAMEKNYRMSVPTASQAVINRTLKNIRSAYLYQHPEYAAYLKAESQFKKYDPNYKLTSTLNNNEYTRGAILSQGIEVGDPFSGVGTIGETSSFIDSNSIDVSKIDPNDINGSLAAMNIDPNTVDPQLLETIISQ